ncbi:hypothetical protein H6G33_12775 [Calothrix sp. FACHB-1219]|uniref:hypothetical protein n=1 Tax=unclassified Calothrix TaxID=2619626 RepID=UPI0016884217|nr:MULTISPECIES: hypothetical protein [unclassified Calothrix]MBD2202503.1 hypothetical protein [Calothrix sp. FACHB-168]MBD2217906.1 hypothetical protein [Calothrix sp. FACHB-1219]
MTNDQAPLNTPTIVNVILVLQLTNLAKIPILSTLIMTIIPLRGFYPKGKS